MAFKALSESLKASGEKTQEYIENKAEYYKLRLFKSVMKFSTSLVHMLVLGSFALLFLAFISIAIALLLSQYLGSLSSGFFIVAGFYFVLFLVIVIFGKNYIIKTMLSKFSALLDDNKEAVDALMKERNKTHEDSDS